MTYKAPDPGKGWRLLKLGEKKVAGETFFYAELPGLGWKETCCAGEIFDSSEVRLGMFYRTREGVKPVKGINYQRLALRMSKAKTIREAREIYNKGVGK